MRLGTGMVYPFILFRQNMHGSCVLHQDYESEKVSSSLSFFLFCVCVGFYEPVE